MNIALIYGGRSGEHEVSVNSARGVYAPLASLGHTIHLIAITLAGEWFLQKTEGIPAQIQTDHPLVVVPGHGISSSSEILPLDVAFAVTHGYGGEDGHLQGLCQLANLPLCGCDTLSSAIGMHKQMATKLIALEGILTIPSLVLDRRAFAWLQERSEVSPSWAPLQQPMQTANKEDKKYRESTKENTNREINQNSEDRWEKACRLLQQTLGQKLFIKPEDGGSSLGVSALRLPDGATFKQAVLKAKKYSSAVLVQALIEPMDELECALLEMEGGELLVAGPALVVDPGKRSNHFLSYQYKYSQVDSAYLLLPSSYSQAIEERIRLYARKAFRAIGAEGYARIDFFVSGEKIYLNEINTFPGMTAKSHYPLLMQHAGYTMEQVIQTLIAHALRRKAEEMQNTYRPPEA